MIEGERMKKIKWLQEEGEKGSLTVEAALIFPWLFGCFLVFLYFFQVMFLHEKISLGLQETAKSFSKYAYVYDLAMQDGEGQTGSSHDSGRQASGDPPTNRETTGNAEGMLTNLCNRAMLTQQMQAYIPLESIASSCVKYGALGMDYGIQAYREEKEICLQAKYQVKFPVFSFVLPSYQMVQKAKTRAFVGTYKIGPGDAQEEEMVYVTANGSVYHTDLSCRHLRLHISSIPYSQVGERRSVSGARYYLCERCARNQNIAADTTVYITPQGNRIHTSLSCPGLSRYVREIPRSEAERLYPPCRNCGGN